jgi:hypothetical protein
MTAAARLNVCDCVCSVGLRLLLCAAVIGNLFVELHGLATSFPAAARESCCSLHLLSPLLPGPWPTSVRVQSVVSIRKTGSYSIHITNQQL